LAGADSKQFELHGLTGAIAEDVPDEAAVGLMMEVMEAGELVDSVFDVRVHGCCFGGPDTEHVSGFFGVNSHEWAIFSLQC
jgi:hypothetical protein